MTFHERPPLAVRGPSGAALPVPSTASASALTAPTQRPTQQENLPVLAKFQSQCQELGVRGYVARHAEIATALLPAFGVFSQGTQLRTEAGSIAIEDALLGDTILDHLGKPVQITWIGETTLAPTIDDAPYLRRVQADRFGLSRPMTDVVLGAGAQVLVDRYGTDTVPLSRFDGDEQILPVRPPAAVRLFNIATDGAQPSFVGADGIGIRTLDTGTFMEGRDPLFVRNFAKLMPGGTAPTGTEPFVTSSPFRRARLG